MFVAVICRSAIFVLLIWAQALPVRADCVSSGETTTITQSGSVKIGRQGDRNKFAAFAIANHTSKANPTRKKGLIDLFDARIMLYAAQCKLVYERKFRDASQVRFETAMLGNVRILHVIALQLGASGSGYQHLLIDSDKGRIVPLEPETLSHSNMGGFYLGDFASGKGSGMVIWDADWAGSESHYEPHHYVFKFYQWHHGGFSAFETLNPSPLFDPTDPDNPPRSLGLKIRDQTGPQKFNVALKLYEDEMKLDQ